MAEKKSVFHRLKLLYTVNPRMVWAMGWVTLVPSLGALISLNFLYANPGFFEKIEFLSWPFLGVYVVSATLLMGLALLPTTFLAILSGFVFGWMSFPFLVLGYTLATVTGYQLGKGLDSGSLTVLLQQYPKAAQLIDERRDSISELIFFVRLSPVIPFALSNLLFALLQAGLSKVIWMGLWGMLPRTTMAFVTGILGDSLLGALEGDSGGKQVVLITLLLLVSLWGIYRFFTKKK